MKQVKVNANILRQDHLEDMAKLSAALHNMLEGSAAAAIAAREKASIKFRKLRSILRTSISSGLEHIDVPNQQAVLREGGTTPRIPLVTKEEIEEVLVPHTVRRFTHSTKKTLLETVLGSKDRASTAHQTTRLPCGTAPTTMN